MNHPTDVTHHPYSSDEMQHLPLVEIFWQKYFATLPIDHPHYNLPLPPAFAFGDNPALADELAQLVLAGIKTATCSSLQHTQIDGDQIFQPGELSIVLSGAGAPLCIIETVESTIRPYNEVDAQFAYEEGEDDRSLEAWRTGHWRFFSRTLPAVGLTPTEEMPLICERFRVIFAASSSIQPHTFNATQA